MGWFGHSTELILSALWNDKVLSVVERTFATGCQHVTIIGPNLTSKCLHLRQIRSPERMLDQAHPSVQMLRIAANENSVICVAKLGIYEPVPASSCLLKPFEIQTR